MSTLFRKEALDTQSQHWYSDTLIAQPPSLRLLVLLSLVLLITLVGFAVLGQYTHRERVSGYLVPDKGLSHVFGEYGGYITKQLVDEGSFVSKGDPLFEVRSEKSSTSGDISSQISHNIQTNIKNIQDDIAISEQLHRKEKRKLQDTLTSKINERKILLLQEQERKLFIKIIKKDLNNYARLYKNKQMSEAELNLKKIELSQAVIALNDTKFRITSSDSSISNLEHDLEAIDLTHEQAKSRDEQRISELERNLITIKSNSFYVVKAPISGSISVVLARPGERVDLRTPLVSILPENSKLEAHLRVPSRAIGFSQVGQEIEIQYDAFPFQKFGSFKAINKSISKSLINNGELDPAQQVYLVKATLEEQTVNTRNRTIELRAGMTFSANMVGDKRSIISWAFEPLLSLKGY
ncbi:HlyD family secretion protein [Agaribacterium sp. ZY112]|uniref:HlyD family secretion protein n=1 Tax=Agaribacterium sp. ZY112 TaxID=3233574 RepID=UPI003523C8E5